MDRFDDEWRSCFHRFGGDWRNSNDSVRRLCSEPNARSDADSRVRAIGWLHASALIVCTAKEPGSPLGTATEAVFVAFVGDDGS